MKTKRVLLIVAFAVSLLALVLTAGAQEIDTSPPAPLPGDGAAAEIPYLEQMMKWSEKLAGLPALPLIFVLCVALGALLKWLPFVANRWIPALIVAAGSLGNLALVGFGGGAALACARAFIIGLIAAVFAIIVFLKFVRDKIPAFETETFKKTGD